MESTSPLAEVVLSHAERAVVRLGDDAFVKVDVSHARLAREEAALRGLTDVRVPEVLWSRPGVLAVSALPGVQLARHGERPDHGPLVWMRVGEVARRIHASPVPAGVTSTFAPDGLGAWIDAERAWLVHDGRVDADLVHARADAAHRHLDDRDVPDAFCHGDLQCEHVLVDADGSIGIVDWGDAGLADPAYDIAVLTAGNAERLDDVLAGYGSSDAMDPDVIAAYWSLRRLGGVHWMLSHGYDATGDIAALSMT